MRVSGAKNSVLKLMAATVLAEGDFVLRNVPHIIDVEIMCDLLVSMGRVPKLSPPGSETLARPNRDRSGPSTTIEARIRSTSS